MEKFNELLEEIQKHLDCTYQNWFFGAGISCKSNVPLMIPLTKKIKKEICKGSNKNLFIAIEKVLPENSHIEHFLSNIGDLLAIIGRTNDKSIKVNNTEYTTEKLTALYNEIILNIAELMRYGLKEAKTETAEEVGTLQKPLVEIDCHRRFLLKLFNTRSNLENRTCINFFTINYDTLLEDALVLEKKEYVDGFSGGAMGFWNPDEFNEKERKPNKFNVFKLHGSIDWYRDNDIGLTRCRYGTKYLSNNSNILIYPQATKYVEVQKDPFATLFNGFRERLHISSGNILVICGYSFGDEHINSEIESAMSLSDSKTNALIFIKENYDTENDEYTITPIIQSWLDESSFNDRVFVLTNRGLYNGNSNLVRENNKKEDYNWWTFQGLAEFIG